MTRSTPDPLAKAKNLVLAIHRRLLPADLQIGWTPYLWIFYLSFFVYRFLIGPPDFRLMAWAGLTVVVFLVLYFHGHWQNGLRVLWNVAGMLAIGVIWAPHNFGAMTFFIYGAGFCGFVGRPKTGRRLLAGILLAVVATALVFNLPWFWTMLTSTLCFMVGATNIYFWEVGRKNADLRRSQEEVERLAQVAERERIARDLHDLLGHTLTVITLKAELARRLVEREDSRAAEEIADVERISRDALAQVREAVTGFRDIGLAGELTRARVALDAAGIKVTSEMAELDLEPRAEATLAMVLREAVTNVVRHSRASHCAIRFECSSSALVLSIEDDGQGSGQVTPGARSARPQASGQGLEGMRQRLSNLGGHLDIETEDGWTLRATLPRSTPGKRASSAHPEAFPRAVRSTV